MGEPSRDSVIPSSSGERSRKGLSTKAKVEFRVPAPGPVSVGTATLPGLRDRGTEDGEVIGIQRKLKRQTGRGREPLSYSVCPRIPARR